MRRVSTFALFVLIFAAGAFGQATPKESLLVLSKHDHTLAIVDPAALKVVAKMPVGADPHEVIATADGRWRTFRIMAAEGLVLYTRWRCWTW